MERCPLPRRAAGHLCADAEIGSTVVNPYSAQENALPPVSRDDCLRKVRLGRALVTALRLGGAHAGRQLLGIELRALPECRL